VVDRYEVFRPAKLLFAKLDETGTFGPILNLVVRTGKPVSFLSTGQQIPEDLEPATEERVLDLLTRPVQPAEALAA
jgi:flagellar biosynthesis protein FlhF